MTASKPTATNLQVALDANAAAYRRAAQSGGPGDCWDFVILTAANEKQAAGYRQELSLRERAVGPTGAFFPAAQRSLVVADPAVPFRVGSGGATLGVLRQLASQFHVHPDDFSRLRILLIHSGGMSQRLPAYSPLGKIFAPLPLLRPDGQIATLFDHLYLTLAGLPERLGPGMLILAGDVFLLFDHRRVTQPPPGVTAITMRVEAELGRGHGVFVTDSAHRIRRTLQKVSVEVMQKTGATDPRGNVAIDTGLLFFDSPRTKLLAKMAAANIDAKHKQTLDLYEDITAALATDTARADFIKNAKSLPPFTPFKPFTHSNPLRTALWKNLHGIPFTAMELDGQFLHLGTTRQFRDAMTGRNPSPAADLFQQNVLAHSDFHLPPGRRVYHSVLLSPAVGNGSVVEHSILRNAKIANGCVVSQVLAEQSPIHLRDNLLFFQAPVRLKNGQRRFVQALCGVEDDFKGNFKEGRCNYLNEPIESWLKRHNISPSEIWPRIPDKLKTLWTAKIFPATESRDAAAAALPLAGKKMSAAQLNRWRKSGRFSMAQTLALADPEGLIEHREIVSAYLQAGQILDAIARHEPRPLETQLAHHGTPAAYTAAIRRLNQWIAEEPTGPAHAIDQARAAWCCARLLSRPDHPDVAAARRQFDPALRTAFAKIAQASEMGHKKIKDLKFEISDFKSQISATAPVRLDLAGGWSDTPPYCFESGGHVINLALNLDNRPPVRATVRPIPHPKIILESADLGRQITLHAHDINAEPDITDPFALHKIAIKMAVGNSLPKGIGLHIHTECRVPKGSGLGASSILAATLLAALHALCGKQMYRTQLIEQTLLLEQRLGAGGGWQDQIGGIVGGVKSTITGPGIPQNPKIEKLRLSPEQLSQLEDRLVVYYSGQQRLARDILRRVMGRWLGREPAVVQLMEQLKNSASALRTALLAGNWPAAARQIARYWQIKKDLYPGSTTPSFDVLMLDLAPHYRAGGLAGAGGGGFGYFLCKDAAQARRLRDLLSERSSQPGSLGAVYNATINRTGLTVKFE